MREKRILPYIAVIMICMFTACSSEDPEILPLKIPEVTGQQMEQNHIQLVFCPIEENKVLTLEIATNDEQEKPVLISWGDGNKPVYYPQGVIEYEYPTTLDEYTITIYSPGVKAFKIDLGGGNRIRSIFFGECPELSQITFPSTPNMIRDIDLRACPQFNQTASVKIYDPEFNFQGLRNFSTMYLYFYHNYPVMIEDLGAEKIELHVTHRSSAITVRDVPNATAINIRGLEAISRIGAVSLQAPAVTDLRVEGIDFWMELPDLTGLRSLRLLSYRCVDADNTLSISPTLEYFEIDNTFTTEPYRIQHLDFTPCKELTHLIVRGVKNLRSLNREGLEKLEHIWIYRSGEVEDLYYTKEKSEALPSGRSAMENRSIVYNNNWIQLTSGKN